MGLEPNEQEWHGTNKAKNWELRHQSIFYIKPSYYYAFYFLHYSKLKYNFKMPKSNDKPAKAKGRNAKRKRKQSREAKVNKKKIKR